MSCNCLTNFTVYLILPISDFQTDKQDWSIDKPTQSLLLKDLRETLIYAHI